MEFTTIVAKHPIVLQAERLCPDRDYPLSVAPEDCRHVFESVMTEEQLSRLETEHWISIEVGLPGAVRGRLFATCHEGAMSALITAS